VNIAWGRVAKFLACAGAGIASGYFGRDWIVNNSDAINLIATIFSVLAGFLIAVMALIADERAIAMKGRRFAHFEGKNIRARLVRHKHLFQLYLVIMLLAFLVTLKLGIPARVSDLMHQTMLGLSVMAFLLSFSLPSQIMSEYLRKLAETDQPS